MAAAALLVLATSFSPSTHVRPPVATAAARFVPMQLPFARMSAAAASDSKEAVIERADDLHADNQVDALFELLADVDTSDDDLAWRYARAHHDKAEEIVGDDKTKEKLLRDGLAAAEACKDRSASNGYALKWYAILLGRLGDFLPTKEKVANSFKIKESLEASAALLPTDSSIQTALGQWCFKVAGISFVERNVAKVLFGSPPESSYDEALKYCLASYDIRPSKKAALFAGLCNDKLKRSAEAKEWMQKCVDLPSFGEADADLDRQAKKML